MHEMLIDSNSDGVVDWESGIEAVRRIEGPLNSSAFGSSQVWSSELEIRTLVRL